MSGSVVFWLKAVTIAVALVYLASCLTPYIDPHTFSLLSLLALGFPVLAMLILVMAIGWLLVDKRVSLWLLLLLFVGYKNIQHVFASNVFAAQTKTQPSLKVITWNVKAFDNNARHAESPDSIRRKMINFLRKENADILLLQEFVEYHNPLIYSNITTLRDSLGYKYFYMPGDYIRKRSYGQVDFGCVIFSRWPLSDTAKLLYTDLSVPEYALTALVNVKGKKLRLFNTHLASFNLYAHPADSTADEVIRPDSAFINNASKTSKLLYFEKLHVLQARQLKAWMMKYDEPLILTGDFNLVPSSYAYYVIKQNLNDAFLKKGLGIGRTFSSLSPTLRIDYLLASQQVKISSYHCPRLYLSDHFPVIVDVVLP